MYPRYRSSSRRSVPRAGALPEADPAVEDPSPELLRELETRPEPAAVSASFRNPIFSPPHPNSSGDDKNREQPLGFRCFFACDALIRTGPGFGSVRIRLRRSIPDGLGHDELMVLIQSQQFHQSGFNPTPHHGFDPFRSAVEVYVLRAVAGIEAGDPHPDAG